MPIRTINRPGSQLLGISGRDDGPVVILSSFRYMHSDMALSCVHLIYTVHFVLKFPIILLLFFFKQITTCSREGVNKIALSGCDARIFCMGVRIVKRRTLQQVPVNGQLARKND